MLSVVSTLLPYPAICTQSADVVASDFLYYDKDGFELNKAEEKYYRAMGHIINTTVLNHTCCQEDWIVGQYELIDHSMILCRCSYAGESAEQIRQMVPYTPFADYLLHTKSMWGFDFALDAVRGGTTFELIHCEADTYNYDRFCEEKLTTEQLIIEMDWEDVADRVWSKRSQWMHLTGFDQNHWKAKYILGWDKAERIEKSHGVI